MRKLMLFCGILFFPLTGNSHPESSVWCTEGSFSAPESTESGVWCQTECFSAPESVEDAVWCTDVAFSAPESTESGVWCQNECFSAPESVVVTSVAEVWCTDVALSVNQQDTVTFHKEERLDSIVVSSNRANMNTPVTYTQITRKQLQRESSGHSLPMMLALQPSVVATTEGGLGLGYTKMSVRGTDDSRTNVTINGIGMNDSESQQVFWVNLPSIHSFLKSAQLQRGVGTSANGSGAFGASLNLETTPSGSRAYGAAEFTVGSYQTYMSTVAAGTGTSPKGFSFDLIYSHGQTDGYIRNAKADLNSLYATAGWKNDNNQLKLSYIFGDQTTGITWEGVSLEMYEKDRRYNIAGEYYDEMGNVHYYDNETDNYQQHYVQAAYSRQISNFLAWNTTLNFTKGDGYYENYKADAKFSKYGLEPVETQDVTYKKSDFIVQQAMDNSYWAANTSLYYNKGYVNASAGISYAHYDGNHFGDVLWCKHLPLAENYRWYRNNGTKQDYSAYARAEVAFAGAFTAYADLQYRGVDYKLEGMDKDFANLDWQKTYSFFNPKAGLTYAPGENSRIYASVAIAHREPSRSDIKESIKSGSAEKLKAEQLTDVELGYRYGSEKLTLSANLYFMEYKNQLVATGRLSEVGYVIKENIPDSYRRGVELAAAWQLCKALRLDANLTLSRNKAVDYTAYVDTYDNPVDWNPVAQTERFFDKTDLILSPEVVGMAMATLTPGAGFECSLSGKYVGRQYMDNFNSEVSKVPAYFVSSLNISKEFRLRRGNAGRGGGMAAGNTPSLTIAATVDNLFNNKYWSYGWIYQAWFADGSAPYVEQGVFAQAPANFMIKMALRF